MPSPTCLFLFLLFWHFTFLIDISSFRSRSFIRRQEVGCWWRNQLVQIRNDITLHQDLTVIERWLLCRGLIMPHLHQSSGQSPGHLKSRPRNNIRIPTQEYSISQPLTPQYQSFFGGERDHYYNGVERQDHSPDSVPPLACRPQNKQTVGDTQKSLLIPASALHATVQTFYFTFP